MWKNCKVVMLSTNEKAIIGDLTLSHNNVLNFAKNEDWLHIYNPIKQHLYITSNEEIKKGDWFIFTYKRIYEINSIYQCTKHNINELKDCKKIIATTDKSITIPGYNSFDEDDIVNCYLPQPSQQFIEKYIEEYNRGNVITDVLVEYDRLDNTYITQADLESLNCTDFTKVSQKYGFEYLDDFWEAMNKKVFLVEDYNVYKIKIDKTHDVHNDYLKGDFLFEIREIEKDVQLRVDPENNTISIKPVKDSWTREEVRQLLIRCCEEVSGVLLGKGPANLAKWIEENL